MTLRVDIITIFEPMFTALTGAGITGRAVDNQLISLHYWNPRDFVSSQYKSVDDRPYGGGPGMVMLAQPLKETWEAATAHGAARPLIYLSPQGTPLTQQRVNELAKLGGFTLLCGRYEGVDQRFLDHYVDLEISIGDFVVSGGELPAMMLLDAVIRRIPGALNDELSAEHDSFMKGLLDHPHYTRPEVFESARVPDVLLSGHHVRIQRWRRLQSIRATLTKRPDLLQDSLAKGLLSSQEIADAKIDRQHSNSSKEAVDKSLGSDWEST